MNIGELRYRGRIEYKKSAKDTTYGSAAFTWELLAVVWCGLQDVLPSRAEQSQGAIDISRNPVRVRMRYRADVDSTMRLVVDRPARTVYQFVAGPAVLGNKDGIELMGEKVS